MLDAADQWLADSEDAPFGLRRIIIEGRDTVARQERVRAADSADEAATRRDVHALREEVRALRQEMAQVRDALRSPVDRAARKGAPDRQDS